MRPTTGEMLTASVTSVRCVFVLVLSVRSVSLISVSFIMTLSDVDVSFLDMAYIMGVGIYRVRKIGMKVNFYVAEYGCTY